MKFILSVVLTLSLTGCYAYLPIKYGANQICGASSERKAELAADFDEATFPHQVRINCHAQERHKQQTQTHDKTYGKL